MFLLPEDQEEWAAFKEYFRASYHTENENLRIRRINILREAKENQGKGKIHIISSDDLEEMKIEASKEVWLSDLILGDIPQIVIEHEKDTKMRSHVGRKRYQSKNQNTIVHFENLRGQIKKQTTSVSPEVKDSLSGIIQSLIQNARQR